MILDREPEEGAAHWDDEPATGLDPFFQASDY